MPCVFPLKPIEIPSSSPLPLPLPFFHLSMEFDLENPLTLLHDLHSSDNSIPSLFLIESDHMLSHTYLHTLQTSDSDLSLRRQTISLISQCSCNIDPHLSYLAINYLDRFFSFQGLPQPKPWVLRLLAISCVSLAAKMKKTVYTLYDFQGDEGFIFDAQTVHRMEVLILGALKWRMRSITPFSFVPFFISLFKLRDPPFLQALKARASEIIFRAQNGIKLLEFKASVIAASALLSASYELFPIQYPCFRKAIFNCSYVNREMLLRCFDAVQDVIINGFESAMDVVQSSNTPANVLDHNFSSSGSENTSITTNPVADKDGKKRKGIARCNNQTVQMSQIQQC